MQKTIEDAVSLSALGFGMLRIDPENPEHREALRLALTRGVDLFDLGDFSRDEIAFRARTRMLLGELAENPHASVIRVLVRGELGSVSRFGMAPQPGVEVIYLIADPEFALPKFEDDHAQLYAEIRRDLDQLETLAIAGPITAYGIGSAAFTYPRENPEALALEPLVGNPHFRWLEFPLNLYESGAVTESNQMVGPSAVPLLEATRAFGLRTIARRPFDALTEDGLRRLVNYPDHHRLDLDEAVKRTLEVALRVERETLEAENQARRDAGADPITLSPLWAHRLRNQLVHVSDPEQWKEIVRRRIAPELTEIRAALPDLPKVYFDAMEALLASARLWFEKAAAERNERLRARLANVAAPGVSTPGGADRDLARAALRIYRSIPGLDAILVGMRSPKYVESLVASAKADDARRRLSPDEIHAAFETTQEALRSKGPHE